MGVYQFYCFYLCRNNDTSRAVWKIPELSHSSEGGGLGSLRAHFDLSSGPSTACALAAQFVCNNTSLSGADFELCGLGYRLSLVKKQIIAGKYKRVLHLNFPLSLYFRKKYSH